MERWREGCVFQPWGNLTCRWNTPQSFNIPILETPTSLTPLVTVPPVPRS